MSAQTRLLNVALGLMVWFIVLGSMACAESPSPPVVGLQTKTEPSGEGSVIRRPALYFQGRDALGKKCHVAATYTVFETQGETHQDWLIQVDYVAPDGHRPILGFAQWFAWESASGRYLFPEAPGGSESEGVLVSMAVSRDAAHESDPNHLDELMKKGQLIEFARLGWGRALSEMESFKELAQQVLAKQSIDPSEKDELNQLKSLVMVLGHGDHYHTPSCLNFQLEGLRVVEFQVQDHNGHDNHDDHDHRGESKP